MRQRRCGYILLILALAMVLTACAAEKLEPPEPVVLTVDDVEKIEIRSDCGCQVDIQQMLSKDLKWDLRKKGPQVLIIHTHATESYTMTGGAEYQESDQFRTLDDAHNMISIGDKVAEILMERGIEVIHDTNFYDYPSYDDAYSLAREAVADHLRENPTIQLVLDLHRDAVLDYDGSQWAPVTEIEGQTSAQLMMVVGTGCAEYNQPHWQENMALAVKLHAQLETLYPGCCREIGLRSSRFNQDLSTGFVLVEVGTAGNTHEEAMKAAEALAEGIMAISEGTQWQKNEDFQGDS